MTITCKNCFVIHASIWFVVFTARAWAQDTLSVHTTVPIDAVTAVTADVYGHLYLAYENGQVQKLDNRGNVLYHFSYEDPMIVDALDATLSSRIFAFSQARQMYFYLERNLGRATYFEFEHVGFIETASLSSDGTIWMIDRQALDLAKYDPEVRDVALRFPFEMQYADILVDASSIQEYESQVFISSPNGVLHVGWLGNVLAFYEGEAVKDMALAHDRLYMLEKIVLNEINLSNGNIETYYLPEGDFHKVLVIQGEAILLGQSALKVVTLPSTSPANRN